MQYLPLYDLILPMINLHNQDCMEAMAGMKEKEFQLSICDPPYGIGVNHNMGRRYGDKPSNYNPAVWDKEPPPVEFFVELRRVSKNQIVWGANHFISRMPIDSPCWLQWDYGFSPDVSFAQFEIAWTSFDRVCKTFYCISNQQNRIHPTQKPVALYHWLLDNYAKPGDRILDTHLGSGSIAIACHDLGFDLDGYEIDKDYYDAACDRLKRHQAQGRLF